MGPSLLRIRNTVLIYATVAARPQPDPLIRPPLQRRSQESLERVLQAGADLLREVGYEGFTLQEVSRRSGVSVGSIYARATSKEALILAIYDRETARMREENRRIEAASLRGDLHGRALVEGIPGAQLVLLEGSAHVLPTDDEHGLAATVREHLRHVDHERSAVL